MLWMPFEVHFQETISFQNPICTFGLLCFVKTTQKQNKTQQKNKNPTKKLFQGIKSFGLDRIIDIWILLQPEEERKRRKYPPGHGAVDRSTLVTRDGRRRGLFWVRVLFFWRRVERMALFSHQDCDTQGLLFSEILIAFPDPSFRSVNFYRPLRLSSVTVFLSAWAALHIETSAWAQDDHF